MRSPRYVPQRLEGVSCKETSRGLTIHFKVYPLHWVMPNGRLGEYRPRWNTLK